MSVHGWFSGLFKSLFGLPSESRAILAYQDGFIAGNKAGHEQVEGLLKRQAQELSDLVASAKPTCKEHGLAYIQQTINGYPVLCCPKKSEHRNASQPLPPVVSQPLPPLVQPSRPLPLVTAKEAVPAAPGQTAVADLFLVENKPVRQPITEKLPEPAQKQKLAPHTREVPAIAHSDLLLYNMAHPLKRRED